MFRRGLMLATAVAAAMLAGKAGAVVVHTGAFLGAADHATGFEGMATHPDRFTIPDGAHLFPGATDYVEGGLVVHHVNVPQFGSELFVKPGDPMTFPEYFPGADGVWGWYALGYNGYTRVTLESGDEFSAVQFLAAGGFASGGNVLLYQLLNNGAVVATSSFTIGDTLSYYGFSGGGFDEVRLQSRNFNQVFDPVGQDYLALDNLSANAVVPEPAAWVLLIAGFGVAGARLRRRRSPCPASPA